MFRDLSKENSIVNQYVSELRDLIFRKTFCVSEKPGTAGRKYSARDKQDDGIVTAEVTLRLASRGARTEGTAVVSTILRAGLPLHLRSVEYF